MIRTESRVAQTDANAWLTGSVATLAAILGMVFFTAAPAQADHEEGAFASHLGRVAASHFLLAGDLIFGHAPVVEVHHYREPRYERRHRHYDGCGHGYHGRKHHYEHHARKHHYKHHRKHHWKHHKRHGHHGRHHARHSGHRGHRDHDDYDRGRRHRVSRHDSYDVGHRGGRH